MQINVINFRKFQIFRGAALFLAGGADAPCDERNLHAG